MTKTATMTVSAIDPDRLELMYASQADERGNSIEPFPAEGWEPLRCCLTYPSQGDSIALIAYSPFDTPSPWSETGPVYIHATRCAGYRTRDELPDHLRTGPRILRTYRADRSLHYDHITLVDEGKDLEQPIRSLLAREDVATVHVRAALTQCFTYAVTR